MAILLKIQRSYDNDDNVELVIDPGLSIPSEVYVEITPDDIWEMLDKMKLEGRRKFFQALAEY